MTGTAFDRLHPAIQFHLVNSLGWRSLRPFQLAAIGPILDGRDALILAPTAGGKTEAAFFPVLSRLLSDEHTGLGALYVCPLKALLNNLEPRLSRYAALVGRKVGVWHGDIGDARKTKMRRNPPDLLLTTPESIEGALISTHTDRELLFGSLRTVIVDELHAFAGDDRGWHLRAVLQRLERYAPARPQRIGLSATVGNPDELLRWFSGSAQAAVVGDAAPPAGGELVVDFVGSLEGAAKVIGRLYRGDKRLVFCDSRTKVETLAALLRQTGVRTFVSHSSLSVSDRRAAEQAFAEERDCVIVATSALELGIDVGDLDRVIQIDAPTTVSSLLQRIGRTGRRPGMTRNCTFLATNDEGLLMALALCRLLSQGYTEPVQPPADPWHIVAQQAMALVMERTPVGRGEIADALGCAFPELDRTQIAALLNHLIATDVLAAPDDLMAIGTRGEREFGARNFLELLSSFTTPALLAVRYGSQELGHVDPVSVQSGDSPTVLLLGGYGWRVQSVDWRRRLVWVEPTKEAGRSRWFGTSRAIGGRLAAAMKDCLLEPVTGCTTSKRASSRLQRLREEFGFLTRGATDWVIGRAPPAVWWTFAGGAANAVLAQALKLSAQAIGANCDDLSLVLRAGAETPGSRLVASVAAWRPPADAVRAAGKELKFSSCLPHELLERCVAARLFDRAGALAVARLPIKRQYLSDESAQA